MATALGFKFEDKNGKELSPVGKNLSHIKTINTANVIEALKSIDFKVACDVTNTLYGEKGAAYVYGPQKGASENEINELDKGLRNIANIFRKQFDIDVQNIDGAGAAGGMGAGSLVFLKAELKSGIDLVKDLIDFDDKIKGASWIVTGEGKLDDQTLSGKTIKGVIDSARENKIQVAAFCGKSELNDKELIKFGISYLDEVLNYARNFDDALANSQKYVFKMAQNFTKKLNDN
jgi:glycerate kinase